MLDPWIIEEIRRREEEEKRRPQQPVIELPLQDPRQEQDGKPAEDTPQRGVTIIDFRVG
jgi:hypothetical protein